MSKRSSRRKRKEKRKQQHKPAALVDRGLDAFQQADYDGAIEAWTQAKGKPNIPAALPAALAEAHLRRALTSPAPGLADLQAAAKLKPADSRYRYHLALAHHRQGDLNRAEPLYRSLLAESPPFERAAAPLAQLLIEQKKAALKEPLWAQLEPETQAQLAAAEALIKGKADSTLRQLAEESLEPLWAGLVALALQDRTGAAQHLQAVLSTEAGVHPLARSVARYYLGAIAAADGAIDTAQEQWRAAQAGGLDSAHLRENMALLTYRQAVAARQAGHPEQAVELLEQIQLPRGEVRAFREQLDWEAGYAAAQKRDWERALSYWQAAEKRDNKNRRLIYNLALAYQHTERFREAAEYWRTLLRRRPRKADHPDALTDKQVARIWQNVADNYTHAGDYDEAITTYKNAVKWAPDNIDLRLKLVDAYQAEGRWQAAENELHRILDKEPDHVPALTLLAESYSEGYYPGQARRLWLRILELEPQNPVARQQLAHSYVEEGSRFSYWGQYKKAIEVYQKGLKQVPDSQRLLVMMGGTYAEMKKFKEARQYLERARAVNPNDLQTLHTIFLIWLEFDSPQDAAQAIEQIKAVPGPVPGGLFLDLSERAYNHGHTKMALELLAYAEGRYGQDDDLLVDIAIGYRSLDKTNRALALMRQVIKRDPNHIEANIELGIIYHEMDQTRLAKRHWQTAETQARRENDQMKLHQIKLIKDQLVHGKRLPEDPIEMLLNMPPELREQLLETAPPDVAEILRHMTPEMLEMFRQMDGFPGFDDEFDDEDRFFL